MSKKTSLNRFKLSAVALIGTASLLLAGCSAAPSGGKAAATDSVTNTSTLFDQKLHDSLPESIRSSGTLKVAVALTDELFSSTQDGKIVGVVADVARQAGEVLGVDVEFIDTPFPGMIPALQSKRVDVIWSTMNDTVEREQTLDFVDWIRTSATFLVASGNPKGIKSIEDICGVRAATIRGAAPMVAMMEEQNAKCVAEGKPAVDMKLYDDFVTGQTQMRSGQIDMFFGPTSKFKYIISLDGGKSGLEIIDATYLGGVYGIGVSKKQPELSAALVEALKILSDDGTYTKILQARGIDGEGFATDEFQINGIGASAFE